MCLKFFETFSCLSNSLSYLHCHDFVVDFCLNFVREQLLFQRAGFYLLFFNEKPWNGGKNGGKDCDHIDHIFNFVSPPSPLSLRMSAWCSQTISIAQYYNMEISETASDTKRENKCIFQKTRNNRVLGLCSCSCKYHLLIAKSSLF